MTIDELEAYGIVAMDDDEIEGFLSSHYVGVLGLPGSGSEAPILRPMSFVYEGGDRLHFLYLEGSGGRKSVASDRAEAARFLVYSAEATFNWRSVLLTGTIDRVTEDEAGPDWSDQPWRPEVFERAEADVATATYRFLIEEREGIEHLGLPEGFSGGRGTEEGE